MFKRYLQVRNNLGSLINNGLVLIGTVGEKLINQTTDPKTRPEQQHTAHVILRTKVSSLLQDQSIRYIVFDQLEDLLGWDHMEECLLEQLLQLDFQSRFFWFILNPLEDTRLFAKVQGSTAGMSLGGFKCFAEHVQEIVCFQTRIRNTKSTSAVLGMLEQRPGTPPPGFPQAQFDPVSAGHTGLPVHLASTCHKTDPAIVGQVAGEIVGSLVHKLDIGLEEITVMLPGFYDNLSLTASLREEGWRRTPSEDYKYFNLELLAALHMKLGHLFPADPKQGEHNSLTPIPVLCLLQGNPTPEDYTKALTFIQTKKLAFQKVSRKIHALLPRVPGVYLSKLLILQAIYNDDDKKRSEVEDRIISYLLCDAPDYPSDYWNYDQEQISFETRTTGNVIQEKVRGLLLHYASIHLLSTQKVLTCEDIHDYLTLVDECFPVSHAIDSLHDFLKRYHYLQVIDADRIRGSESEVVVACVRFMDNSGHVSAYGNHPHVSAKVSRAKALAVSVLIACEDEAEAKKMWPGPYHDWKCLLPQ